MYLSKIVITEDIDAIEKLFIPEDKILNRAEYTITREKNQLVFNIKANDATALKTAFNTITKVLLVWEKTAVLTSKKGSK